MYIPNFNINGIQNLINMIDDNDNEPYDMTPYYNGFKGHIEIVSNNMVHGKMEIKKDSKQIMITELPIGQITTLIKLLYHCILPHQQ